jgi:hypothetical protein
MAGLFVSGGGIVIAGVVFVARAAEREVIDKCSEVQPPSGFIQGQKTELTRQVGYIKVSASVDNNGLIESGEGTGPMKPRQPAQVASLSDQVPNPARRSLRGKMRRRKSFVPLLIR